MTMRRTITEKTGVRLIRMAHECDAIAEKARAMQFRFAASDLDHAAMSLCRAAHLILVALDKGS